MNEGDLVWRADILGYKGILLTKEGDSQAGWTVEPQLTFDYKDTRWKVFWFQHPFSPQPIIDVMPERLLKKITDDEKRLRKHQI